MGILISQKFASCVFAFPTGQINYYAKIDLYSDSKRYKEVIYDQFKFMFPLPPQLKETNSRYSEQASCWVLLI